MARIVPASSSLCRGNVSVCFSPLAVRRRILMCDRLGVECETEAGENRDEVVARQPLRFSYEQDPTPSLGEEWDFGKVQVPEGSLLQGGGRLLLEDW